jgi:hypothetical protein
MKIVHYFRFVFVLGRLADMVSRLYGHTNEPCDYFNKCLIGHYVILLQSPLWHQSKDWFGCMCMFFFI